MCEEEVAALVVDNGSAPARPSAAKPEEAAAETEPRAVRGAAEQSSQLNSKQVEAQSRNHVNIAAEFISSGVSADRNALTPQESEASSSSKDSQVERGSSAIRTIRRLDHHASPTVKAPPAAVDPATELTERERRLREMEEQQRRRMEDLQAREAELAEIQARWQAEAALRERELQALTSEREAERDRLREERRLVAGREENFKLFQRHAMNALGSQVAAGQVNAGAAEQAGCLEVELDSEQASGGCVAEPRAAVVEAAEGHGLDHVAACNMSEDSAASEPDGDVWDLDWNNIPQNDPSDESADSIGKAKADAIPSAESTAAGAAQEETEDPLAM